MSGSKVFLLDDDPSIIRAMTRYLESLGFEVLAFQSAQEFLFRHDMQIPGCAVLDVCLGDSNGLEVYRALSRAGKMRPTIFITGVADVITSVRAMKAGAVDFLMKPVHEAELGAAIHRAIARDLQEREERAKQEQLSRRIASLTPRERQVLAYVVAGETNPRIAALMEISEKTVKIHRGQVMKKMKAPSLAHLVRLVEPRRQSESIVEALHGKRVQ